MQLELDSHNPRQYYIQRYDPKTKTLIINNKAYAHSLLLTTENLKYWSPQNIDELCSENFECIVSQAPEVVLLGTGCTQIFPPTAVFAPCIEANLSVEVMNTGAACRTFNVLVSEGRRVIAALLL